MNEHELAVLERNKYLKAWKTEGYRNYSPGENVLPHFLLSMGKPKVGSSIIDFGTGTGRAAKNLAELGYAVRMVDIANNCLDEDVKKAWMDDELDLDFYVMNLWDRGQSGYLPMSTWGYCTDVMEHSPPEEINNALNTIMSACHNVFFHICLTEDHFGKKMGETLHLTVKPFNWWLDKLSEFGEVTDARDLINNAAFVVRHREGK